MSNVCIYCKARFKTKSLIRHQKTAKYCLQKREESKVEIDESDSEEESDKWKTINPCGNIGCTTNNCPGCTDDSWGNITYTYSKTPLCPRCQKPGNHCIDGSQGDYWICN
jgi:hypothetical protein